ncbi:MAG: M28 family peptidase [Pirellulaceae bacterium]
MFSKSKLFSIVSVLFFASSSLAEDLSTSAVARMKSDLTFLASDELKGRDTGSEGIAEAGEFIATRFRELGIGVDGFDGSPFQDFSIPGTSQLGEKEKNYLSFSWGDKTLDGELGVNFTSVSLGSNGSFECPVVFAGYGISAPDLGYDDYEGIDVEGKVVIVIRKEPQQQNADSIFEGQQSSRYAYFSSKELTASLKNAAALIIVNDSVTASRSDQVMTVTAAGAALSDKQVPTFHCQRSLIDPILKEATGRNLLEMEAAIDADLKTQSVELEGVTVRGEAMIEEARIPVRNVIGYLPGSGELADEWVVVGAHYDHVGMGRQGSLSPGTLAIHNGADDNGSGTVTMLEVARRFATQAAENRRGILFMAFTGEEKGLLGSKYYARNPRWPLEKTVAMVNMDMVGRLKDDSLTIYGTGTAEEFDGLIDELNEVGKFNLAKQPEGFGPSDHSSFYEKEIPVFHFFTGLHNDYHRPGDDVEKVNFDGMARIATMIFSAVDSIATTEKKPSYVNISGRANVGRSRPTRRRAVLGVQLDLNYRDEGARIAEATQSGAAAKAGVEEGDVIVKIGDTDIESVLNLRQALGNKRPGDKIKVTLQRGSEEKVVEITLSQG